MAGLVDRIMVVIDATSSGAVQELDTLQKEAKKSGDSFDNMGKKMGLAGNTIKAGLAAGAAAVVGGGLIKLLNDSVDAFVDSQEAARQWASLTNSSIQQAGKFTTVLKNYGLEINDLVEINAELSAKIKDSPALFEKYGIAVVKAKNGTTDMTATMANTITALSKIPDGVEKTQAALALLGEEGGKQLLPLINSGRDLNEMMDKINFVDNSEAAKDFAANSADLALSFQQMQIQLGSFLVPYLNDLLGLASGVIEFFSTLPGWVIDVAEGLAIAAGSVYAFNTAMKVMQGDAIGKIIVGLLDGIGKIPDKFFEAEGAAAKARVGFGLAGDGLKNIAKAIGPGLAVTALVAIGLQAKESSDQLKKLMASVSEVKNGLDAMAQSAIENGNVWEDIRTGYRNFDPSNLDAVAQKTQEITQNLGNQAIATLQSADATDEQKQAARELLAVMGTQSVEQQQLNLKTTEGKTAWLKYTEAMSGVEQVQAEVALSAKTLEEAVGDIALHGAEAATTQEQLAAAVQAAGEAQEKQKTIAHETDRAMLGYATSSEKASFWQEEMNILLEDGIDQGERFTTATDEAAQAIFRQSENSRIAEEALDKLNFTYGQLVEDLLDTDPWDAGPEKLKQSLDNLDFKQVGDDYVNEMTIASDEGRNILLTGLAAALEDAPTLDPIAWLEDFKAGAPPELVSVITKLQEEITNNPLTVPVNVEPNVTVDGHDFSAEDIRKQIADAAARGDTGVRDTLQTILDNALAGTTATTEVATNVTVTLTGVDGPDGAQAKVNALAVPSTSKVTVTTAFDPAYNDIKARLDFINSMDGKSPDINVYTHMNPEYNDIKARLDYINSMDGKSPDIDVWTHMHPEYDSVKRQLDYINSMDGKTPDINVYIHLFPSYETMKARLDELSRNRTATISVRTAGLAAATAQMNALAMTSGNQVIRVPAAPPAPTPINLVRVSVDGQQLRSVIREELGYARAGDDLAAAMGVRA